MDHSAVYLIIACVVGLIMTWGIGANDLANVMSTTLGSKAVTLRQAIIIAIIFEYAGALLGGQQISNTMTNGIFNIDLLMPTPYILIYGLLAVLSASMVWINLASYLGLPVSITHSIIGGLVGFGLVVLGPQAIHWDQVGQIALTWLLSPVISGATAFFLFHSVQRLIISTSSPLQNARRYIPLYTALIGLVFTNMIVFKGLDNFGYTTTFIQSSTILLLCTAIIMLATNYLISKIPVRGEGKLRMEFTHVEKQFGILMGFTACCMVFAHGSNDVAVAMGPISLIQAVMNHTQFDELQQISIFPSWLLVFGTTGVILGLLVSGHRVIATVGKNITTLTPSRAFTATIAAASTVIVSTSLGIPLSTTQTLVGGVLGVGLAGGIGALNIAIVRNILLSWIITLPISTLLSISFFLLFRLKSV